MCAAHDAVAAVLQLSYFLAHDRVVLIIYLADQFFNDVFHRHQSFGATILIDYDSDMRLHRLHPLKKVCDLHRFGDEYDRFNEIGYFLIRTYYIVMKIFVIQNSQHVIDIILKNRHP